MGHFIFHSSSSRYTKPSVHPPQLGFAGSYISAPTASKPLRERLSQDRSLIKLGIDELKYLREDQYTSKAGGLPRWLCGQPDFGSPLAPLSTQNYTHETLSLLPRCLSCGRSMMFVTQVFAPVDVGGADAENIQRHLDQCSESTSSIPPSVTNASLPPCYAASSFATRSTHPQSSLLEDGRCSRYPRCIYVFGCNMKKCNSKPGSWRAIVQCDSQSKSVVVPTAIKQISQSASSSDNMVLHRTEKDINDNDDNKDDEDDAVVSSDGEADSDSEDDCKDDGGDSSDDEDRTKVARTAKATKSPSATPSCSLALPSSKKPTLTPSPGKLVSGTDKVGNTLSKSKEPTVVDSQATKRNHKTQNTSTVSVVNKGKTDLFTVSTDWSDDDDNNCSNPSNTKSQPPTFVKAGTKESTKSARAPTTPSKSDNTGLHSRKTESISPKLSQQSSLNKNTQEPSIDQTHSVGNTHAGNTEETPFAVPASVETSAANVTAISTSSALSNNGCSTHSAEGEQDTNAKSTPTSSSSNSSINSDVSSPQLTPVPRIPISVNNDLSKSIDTPAVSASYDDRVTVFKPFYLTWDAEPQPEHDDGEDGSTSKSGNSSTSRSKFVRGKKTDIDDEHVLKLLNAYKEREALEKKTTAEALRKLASGNTSGAAKVGGNSLGSIVDTSSLGDKYTQSAHKSFKRFTLRVGRAPSQMIRYVSGGGPLQLHDSYVIPLSTSKTAHPRQAKVESSAEMRPSDYSIVVNTSVSRSSKGLGRGGNLKRTSQPEKALPGFGGGWLNSGVKGDKEKGGNGSHSSSTSNGGTQADQHATSVESLLATIPQCSCGGGRRLEMQLMPNFLNQLHADETSEDEGEQGNQELYGNLDSEKKDSTHEIGRMIKEKNERVSREKRVSRKAEDAKGMDWGTIDIYTCVNACGLGGSVDGFIAIQPPA